MKELKGLQDSVEQIEKLYSDYEDLSLLIEMSEEDADEETVSGIEEELKQFEDTFEELRIGTLLTGPYDRDNRYAPCRGRRDRVLRLDEHAVPYVYQMGGKERIPCGGPGLSGGRCGRHQGSDL